MHSRSGQAAIEFAITIIALLLIISGGIFLFQLNTAQRDMTTTLRADAGHAALSGITALSAPDYIRAWEDGPDGRPGTADDIARNGRATVFNDLANHGAENPADWERVQNLLAAAAPDRDRPSFLDLQGNPMPMSSLGFVREHKQATVPIDRFLRELLFNKDAITIEHEVFMPSCSNLH